MCFALPASSGQMDALDPAEAVVPICFSCYLVLFLLVFRFFSTEPFFVLFAGLDLGLGGWMGWDGLGWRLRPLYSLDGGWIRGLMQSMCILHGDCCFVVGGGCTWVRLW